MTGPFTIMQQFVFHFLFNMSHKIMICKCYLSMHIMQWFSQIAQTHSIKPFLNERLKYQYLLSKQRCVTLDTFINTKIRAMTQQQNYDKVHIYMIIFWIALVSLAIMSTHFYDKLCIVKSCFNAVLAVSLTSYIDHWWLVLISTNPEYPFHWLNSIRSCVLIPETIIVLYITKWRFRIL